VLYVINHAGGRHTIEVYDVGGARLVHRDTLSDPLLVTPNDLVAVGPDELYVTNDHANTEGLAVALENYLRRSISNVVYWNGVRFSEAASDVRFPNGINTSADGSRVFVASTTGYELLVYERDRASGRLRLERSIEVGSGVDNIERDAEGALWVGAHPKLLTFVRHAGDASVRAPSQVFRVTFLGELPRVEEVFLSLGDDLSGSSVAAVHAGHMLVGSAFDDNILDCALAE
jgi:arylesterase/paraoxonase